MKLKKIDLKPIECIGCHGNPKWEFEYDGKLYYLCDTALDAAVNTYIEAQK